MQVALSATAPIVQRDGLHAHREECSSFAQNTGPLELASAARRWDRPLALRCSLRCRPVPRVARARRVYGRGRRGVSGRQSGASPASSSGHISSSRLRRIRVVFLTLRVSSTPHPRFSVSFLAPPSPWALLFSSIFLSCLALTRLPLPGTRLWIPGLPLTTPARSPPLEHTCR
jgi:hypothetical protein